MGRNILTRLSGYCVIALLLATLVPYTIPAHAQVAGHIWKADTAWFYPQINSYIPESVEVAFSLVNAGTDTVYNVRLDLGTQNALFFVDGTHLLWKHLSTGLPPGDSIVFQVPLHYAVDSRMLTPQQLMWFCRWEEGATRLTRSGEGHAVAFISGDCPEGNGRDALMEIEIRAPDSLLLDPGTDGSGREIHDVLCRVYRRDGRACRIEDVRLYVTDPHWESIAQVEILRETPADSVSNLTLGAGDTLSVRFRVSVPYVVLRRHVAYTGEVQWSSLDRCDNGSRLRKTRTHALKLVRRPIRFISSSVTHSYDVSLIIQSIAWCGDAPAIVDSGHISVTDNGIQTTLDTFIPTEYGDERRSTAAVFIVDVSSSVGEEALHRIRTAVGQWHTMLDPRYDSMAVYSVADDVRLHVPFGADSAIVRAGLSELQVREGYDVCASAYDVIAMIAARQPDARVMIFFVTDGWDVPGSINRDSLRRRAERSDFVFSVYTASDDVNMDNVPELGSEASRRIDAQEMHRAYLESIRIYQRYRTCRYLYSYQCWTGSQRDISVRYHDVCGMDTIIQLQYTLPYDSTGNRDLRLSFKDTEGAAGTPLKLPLRCDNAYPSSRYRVEMAVRYDASLLRFDSLSVADIEEAAFYVSFTAVPGFVLISATIANDRGFGDVMYACFTPLSVQDTVVTDLRLEAWHQGDVCRGLPSRDAAITIVPHTTGMSSLPNRGSLRLISAYPQPASTTLYLDVQLPESSMCRYRLTDLLGREMATGIMHPVQTGEVSTNIPLPPGLRSGMYLIELRQGGNLDAAWICIQR